MQDDKIISLYFQRDETAISETDKKYGNYLTKIAYNILFDWEDSRESVNDTYLKAWNSIPPNAPKILSTYLGRITRQTSIDIFRKRNSQKRQASQYAISLSELEECIPKTNYTGDSIYSVDSTVQEADLHLLAEAISAFLRTLPKETCNVFIGRYYFVDSMREIADYSGMSVAKVKSMLHRTRIGLKNHLKQEGFKL